MFGRKKREADLERELRSHLELEAEERAGDSSAARRAFGNPALVKEDTRAAWGWTAWERFLQDLRYAARTLGKNPGFAVSAILSLALGIGASTAIFTVVDGVLLRPLPYPEPDRLVRLWESNPKRGITNNVVNGWNFLGWRERTRSFEGIAATQQLGLNLTGQGEPVAFQGLQVSANFFDILRVPPLLGRTFNGDDEVPGRGRSIVLSHKLWQTHFGANRSLIGARVIVNGAPATVAGVMPPGFSFPGSVADAWVPLSITRSRDWERGRSLSTVARLKPGVTLEQAREDMVQAAAQLAQERPDYNKDRSAEAVPLLEDTTRGVRSALLVLMAAVTFLLLIACANVANLFLMRGAQRSREVNLRQTLGASRLRIVRQFLTESLLVSFLAALLGVAAGYAGVRTMLSLLPESASLPRTDSIILDARVLAFALAAATLTTLLFGLVPLTQAGRFDLQSALRFRGRTASKQFRRAFVALQVALTLILLVGAGLMTRSFSRLLAVDPGFAVERVLAVDIFASPSLFSEPRARSEYFERILTGVRDTPGVQAASSIHFLPLEQRISRSCFGPPEDPSGFSATLPSAEFLVVGSGYFAAAGIPVERGREFGERDRFGSPPVIVVNRAFAERQFPNENPLGRRLYICWGPPNTVAEIAGVVSNSRQSEVRAAPAPTIYVANAQAPSFFASLMIRTRDDPGRMARAVMDAIHRVNPDQAIPAPRTMEQVFNNSVAQPRFQFLLLLIFAGVALTLAAIGVYGVVSYSVAQRTQEIGVRVAIGASRRDIAALVLKEGLLVAVAGVAVGLGGALSGARFMESLLYETASGDPLTLASMCGLLLAVTTAALIVPLLRATRVDPTVALRYE